MRGSILANAKMPTAPAVKMMHSQRYGVTMPLSLLSVYSLQENRAGARSPPSPDRRTQIRRRSTLKRSEVGKRQLCNRYHAEERCGDYGTGQPKSLPGNDGRALRARAVSSVARLSAAGQQLNQSIGNASRFRESPTRACQAQNRLGQLCPCFRLLQSGKPTGFVPGIQVE